MKYFFLITVLLYACDNSKHEYIEMKDINGLIESYNVDENEEIKLIDNENYLRDYYIELDNEAIYQFYIGNLFFIYENHYSKIYSIEDFFFGVLNSKINLPFKLLSDYRKERLISGDIFLLENQIKTLNFIEIKNNFTKKKDQKYILKNDLDLSLNQINTISYYFYLNGYDRSIDDYAGITSFIPRTW